MANGSAMLPDLRSRRAEVEAPDEDAIAGGGYRYVAHTFSAFTRFRNVRPDIDVARIACNCSLAQVGNCCLSVSGTGKPDHAFTSTTHLNRKNCANASAMRPDLIFRCTEVEALDEDWCACTICYRCVCCHGIWQVARCLHDVDVAAIATNRGPVQVRNSCLSKFLTRKLDNAFTLVHHLHRKNMANGSAMLPDLMCCCSEVEAPDEDEIAGGCYR